MKKVIINLLLLLIAGSIVGCNQDNDMSIGHGESKVL